MERIQELTANVTANVTAQLTTLKDNINPKTIIYGVVAIVLGFYGPRMNAQVPPTVRSLFHHPVVRTLVILLIVYVSTFDLQLTLLLMIAFLLISNLVYSQEAKEAFQNKVREAFEDASAEKHTNKDMMSQAGHLTDSLHKMVPQEHPGSVEGFENAKQNGMMSSLMAFMK